MEDYFSEGGALHQRLGAGWRPRPAQQQLVQIVRSMQAGDKLAINAPVAVGKNDAIGVGALLSGVPTVVSTFSLALLDQLEAAAVHWRQDFPDKRIITIRGRARYVCAAKLAELRREHANELVIGAAGEARKARRLAVLQHAEQSDLIAGGPEGIERLAQTSCPGRSKCQHSAECAYYTTRDACADADLVLTSHAQVFANVDYPSVTDGHWFTCAQWLADEGDQLLDAASDDLGVSGWGLRAVLRDARASREAVSAVKKFAENLHALLDKAESNSATFSQKPWQAFIEARSQAIVQCITEWPGQDADADEDKALGALKRMWRVMRSMKGDKVIAGYSVTRSPLKHKSIASLPSDEQQLARLSVQMRYVDLGDTLRNYADHFQRFAAISGSIALPTRNGMDFSFFERRSGIPLTDRISISSPIDYESNLCVLHAPIEEKDRLARGKMFAQFCAGVAQETGPCLILCTSYLTIQEVEAAFAALALPLLVQQSDSTETVAALAQQVKAGRRASICGNKSAWIGLDLHAAYKSVVIIEKVPMPSPSIDLVLEGYLQRDGQRAWSDYGAKQALKQSTQGVGRTLRRESDRCLLIVCDARFWGDYAAAIPGGQTIDYTDGINWSKTIVQRCADDREEIAPHTVACDDFSEFLEGL